MVGSDICLRRGILDVPRCVPLCLIFKLWEFTPLKHYFKVGFRGTTKETHLNLPSFIKYFVKPANFA